MIKLQAIGHLGKDCIVNQVDTRTVINFTVAHSEKWKDQNGVPKEKTTWIECAYWTDRSSLAPYLKKGQQVYVEGIPEADYYTTQDGKVYPKLKCRVLNIQLLGAAKSEQQAPPQNQHYDRLTGKTDDLPF